MIVPMKNLHTKNDVKYASKGFTLIELLLYVSISAVLLLALSLFLSTLLEARVKTQVMAEVDGHGAQVMHLITQTVRNAEGVTSPTTGSAASTLTLDVIAGASDPTVFDLSGEVIRIAEGAGSAATLTNSRVTASGLSFSNLSRASTPGVVRIMFTLTAVNTTGRNEYDYTKTFYGSASLRQP